VASTENVQLLPVPSGGAEPGDQRVVIHGVRWEQYVALDDALEDQAGVRMTYLDGALEIMTLSRRHEHVKTLIARLVEAYAEERGISLNGFGSETFRKKMKESALEPDECYCIGPEKEFPDLAIEVVVSSGGVDKLEVYRRLGVSEVWFWVEGAIQVYRLSAGAAASYARRERSRHLPGLDVGALAAIVAATDRSHQTEAVRRFRRSLSESPGTASRVSTGRERAVRGRRRPR
jgi:Uma2 family endonuclease